MHATQRIAMFLPDLGSGGAERVFLMLAAQFAARGYGVDLVLARAQGSLLSRVPEGVEVVDLAVPRWPGGTTTLAVGAVLSLGRYLRIRRPAALLSTLTGANLVATAASRSAGGRIRVVLREAAALENTPSRLRRYLMRVLYPRADAIIAVSHRVSEDMRALGLAADRVLTIPNPVDIQRLRTLAAVGADHPWLQGGKLPVILGLGRLAKQKDFETLIHAFALVTATVASRLLIIGEGPERERLERLIGTLGIDEAVQLAGYSENPYPSIKHAAVFALSSRWEGYPNALVEALALGTPVVATDCPGGSSEILLGGELGTLVPVGDRAAMAKALQEALLNPAPDIRRRGHLEAHTPGNIAEHYLQCLGLEPRPLQRPSHPAP